MRLVVSLALALLVAAPAAAARESTAYWSTSKLLRRLDGSTVRIGVRRVRVEADTTLCSGDGRSVRRGHARLWRDFWCTYTTFTKAGVDRDLDFRVHVRSARRFVIRDAHWIPAR